MVIVANISLYGVIIMAKSHIWLHTYKTASINTQRYPQYSVKQPFVGIKGKSPTQFLHKFILFYNKQSPVLCSETAASLKAKKPIFIQTAF